MLETLGSTLVRRTSHRLAARRANRPDRNSVKTRNMATLLGKTSQMEAASAAGVVATLDAAEVHEVAASRTFNAEVAVTLEEADVAEEEADIEASTTMSDRATEAVGCNTSSIDPMLATRPCSTWITFC